jgi:hypothetical protein
MSRILLQLRYTTTATLKKLQKAGGGRSFATSMGKCWPAGELGCPSPDCGLGHGGAAARCWRAPQPTPPPWGAASGGGPPPSAWDAAARQEAPPHQPGQQLRRLSWKEQHPRPWLWRNSGLTPLARTTMFDLCRAVLGSRRRTTGKANPLPRAELHGCLGPQCPCYGSVYGYEFSEEIDDRWRKTWRKGSQR